MAVDLESCFEMASKMGSLGSVRVEAILALMGRVAKLENVVVKAGVRSLRGRRQNMV